MDTLELLTTRRSSKQLIEPGPDDAQLNAMLNAATQVPDHGLLNPYRFVVIEEHAMPRFAAALQEAAVELALDDEGMQKAKRVGSMAPLVIGVIAAYRESRIPKWEQLLTAGCSAYAIQLAAKAQGFDNVWISGKWVASGSLRRAFACTADEEIIALLMIGSAQNAPQGAKNEDLQTFVTRW